MADNALQKLENWQHLSPIALLYFSLQSLQAVFGSVFYLIPLTIFTYRGLQDSPLLTLGVMLLGLGLFAGIAVLRYYFHQFRVSGDTVDIQAGIIQKTQLNLPFERIQNVKLEQPLYYRFTDHVMVQLDTAGSSREEAQLVALSRLQAEALQHAIYAAHSTTTITQDTIASDIDDVTDAIPSERLLNRRSVGDLLIYGISNNRVWVFLAATTPFWDNALERISGRLETLGVDVLRYFDPTQQSLSWLVVLALGIALLVVMITGLLSVAGAMLSFFDYSLVQRGERYIQRCGLFTRHEVSMKLSRLQWVQLQQSWLDRVFGRCNVRFEQIQAPRADLAEAGRIMIPAVTPLDAQALLAEALPEQRLAEVVFQPIDWRFLIRPVLFCLVMVGLSQWLLRPDSPLLANVVLLIGAWVGGLIVLRWRRWGYALDSQFLYIRKGLIGVNYYCLPIFKVQQVSYAQSWWLQRKNLCHVRLVFASGAQGVPFIPWAAGKRIVNDSLYQAESSGRSWM
ncbi:PH domain-containing protein [Thiothrix subterranea]|uniref:PH domain-containing protein n=1 Tax=Thiothrix subterranea TaxID=2735563 RepID=UPI00192CD03B|nr:PH domain-containing protein [Thiothrix subterranea]QQZ28341.1 PH domain-containing protein [Thiothrix subterranea]